MNRISVSFWLSFRFSSWTKLESYNISASLHKAQYSKMRKENEMKFYWYWTRACSFRTSRKEKKKIENLSCKEILRELQHRNYDNTSTVRYIQISTPFSCSSPAFSALPHKGMTFLSNFMMMTKKYWKYIFSHINYLKRFRRRVDS